MGIFRAGHDRNAVGELTALSLQSPVKNEMVKGFTCLSNILCTHSIPSLKKENVGNMVYYACDLRIDL